MPRKPPAKPEEVRLESTYRPLPPQLHFHNSQAKVRAYGGAMGGGKSRALCEEAYKLLIEFPGTVALVCRQAHTSIINTTKKTMIDEVLPAQFIRKSKESGGEDYVELHNGSVIHFIGLDDPVRWFSSEIGLLVFDEAHEIAEDDVLRLITRLRQRNAPLRVMIAFNPENPGHWLQHWFILGASQNPFGFEKDKLFARDSEHPLGDCEFVFAKATDNPHLPDGYIDTALASLPEFLRKRYLDGLWEFISGTCYFDQQSLADYEAELKLPYLQGITNGDITGEDEKNKIRLSPRDNGPWSVWKPPVREHYDKQGEKVHAHRYVAAVDTSSGGAQDYSGIQIIDVENFEQVARYQGKTDPDLVALEAFRAARVYNDALIAPETTGGWGFSVVKELQRISRITPHKVRIYTRPIIDRLTNKFTDKLGWDTNTKTRAYMLDTLERTIREREFGLYDRVTYTELGTFVRDERGRPAAQPGCCDDLTIALAIGVTLATQMPKQLRRIIERPHVPELAATGW